jgi:xanthine dehydrogenase D subunit
VTRGVGASTLRPDGLAKATGAFVFAGDLSEPGMLWGAVLRCPFPHARLVSLDLVPARAVPGVVSVLSADDVPGLATYGLDHPDQPVFTRDVARFHGEPVVAVAATTLAAARAGCAAVAVEWDRLPVVVDTEEALAGPALHPDGNLFRRVLVEKGDPSVEGEVVVEASYVIGTQDQAFLGTEAALAMPSGDGGVRLRVATQDLHADRGQIAACLGLAPEQVTITLGGVGGAFGGREDMSLQVHVCLLALATGLPVKMVYSREESFLGHVHRHAMRLHYRTTAERDGRLVSQRARILLDGGAYASTTGPVTGNAATMAAGPYVIPNVRIDAFGVRTNNPPSGAMRGFGAVQVCAAYEAQMDLLAHAVGLDPLELRRRNVLATGDTLATGQVVHSSAPLLRLIDTVAGMPMPPPWSGTVEDLPGGPAADPSRVRRGVGYGLGFKNLAFSEGFDDPSTAMVRLEVADGRTRAVVHTACAEVGQGFVTIVEQIVRTELGLGQEDEVLLLDADTLIGPAGSTSASRQTWMSGGAVQLACTVVAHQLVGRVAAAAGMPPAGCLLRAGRVVAEGLSVPLLEALADGPVEAQRTFRHRKTAALDARGQGDAHVAWSFVIHRAVVDVDLDLGTVRLVQLATVQDVGKALNPLSVLGQIEGGTAQGVGFALTEELALEGGFVTHPTFSEYLIPNSVDLPMLLVELVEEPEPDAPFGAKGVGEAPTVSSPAAVMAAMRDATGLALTHLPVRAEHLAAGSSW